MLNHPTHERLIELGLTGMAKAFEEQRRSPDLEALPFEDRIGLLVDREAAERDTRRLTTRLKIAALRQTACVEDVDLRTPVRIATGWVTRTPRLRACASLSFSLSCAIATEGSKLNAIAASVRASAPREEARRGIS